MISASMSVLNGWLTCRLAYDESDAGQRLSGPPKRPKGDLSVARGFGA